MTRYIKLLFLICAFLGSVEAIAQKADIALTMVVTQTSHNEGSNCWETGQEEYTGKVWFWTEADGTQRGGSCRQCSINGDCNNNNSTDSYTYTNTTAEIMDARMDAWEDDRGDRCDFNTNGGFFENDDDCRTEDYVSSTGANRFFREVSYPSNGGYMYYGGNQNDFGDNDHWAQVGLTWKYSGSANAITMSCTPQSATQSAGRIRSQSVYLASGKSYRFQTISGPDTYLRLYGTDGYTIVAANDDGGTGSLSLINYTAPSSGWYYIETSLATRSPLSSNAVLEFENTTVNEGNNALFGTNEWRVYGYNQNSYDFANQMNLNNVRYEGFYVDGNVDVTSTDRWASGATPSDASGWTGCDVTIDNHTVVYKRQGFPCGYYNIDLDTHDDGVRAYVNGASVYEINGCCVDRGVIWTGFLDATSTVEFRVSEGVGGSNLAVDFDLVSNLASASSTQVAGCNKFDINVVKPSGSCNWFQSDFSAVNPANTQINGVASYTGGLVQLTPNTGSSFGSISIDNTKNFNASDVALNFNFFIGDGGGADGMSVSYGNVAMNANLGESGGGNGLIVRMITYGSPRVQLVYNGTVLATYNSFPWRNMTTVPVSLNVVNGIATVVINGSTIFNNVNLGAGYLAANKSAWRWNISARTGGVSDRHYIDNVKITANEYEYSIGSGWQSSPAFTNLTGGNTYTVQIRPKCAPSCATTVNTIALPNVLPTASAGGSQTICTDETATVSGASSSNGTISWSENGAGSITSGGSTLTPIYTPSAGDAGNTVTLTMTVSSSPCTAATATYSVHVLAPVGNPAIFPNSSWNLYAYRGNNFQTYVGYYNKTGLDFNTSLDWGINDSPSAATSYSGCLTPFDNHSFSIKRQGFTCGIYDIKVPNYDDDAVLKINGTTVWSNTCCSIDPAVVRWTGYLDGSSTIELALREYGGGSIAHIDLTDITTSVSGGTIAGITNGVTICTGGDPGAFTNTVSPSGGTIGTINGSPAAPIYQWQQATNAGFTTGLTSVGSNSLTYDPGTLTTGTYYFRRKVTDACSNVAYSNVIQVVVVADPIAPTLNTATPASGSNVCAGSTVKATFNAGSNGTSCTDEYRSSINGGSSWTAYTAGANIAVGATGTTTLIQARRDCSGTACDGSAETFTTLVTWSVSKTESTAPTGATASNTFGCTGEAVDLSVVNGSLGTGASWKWYSEASFSTLVGSGSPLTVYPTATTSYYVRAEGDCNTIGNQAVTVSVNGTNTVPSSSVVLASATDSSSCIVNDNNWHHFYNDSGELLASINSKGENLGEVKVKITVGNSGPFGQGLAPGVCGYSGASAGEFVMPRYWDITVANQPSNGNPSDVRFYYTTADVTSLVATTGAQNQNYKDCWGEVASESDLMMTIDHGTSLDPVAISPSVPSFGGSLRQIEFSMTQFSGGKLHSNKGLYAGNALPVELIDFTAKTVDNKFIQLNWRTASEINNEGFDIERSQNGIDFEKIGFIAGNGNRNNVNYYSYQDNEVNNGTYYYRLKQVDFDGAFEYSDIRNANIFGTGKLAVSYFIPNPAENQSSLNFISFAETEVSIVIYDGLGRKLIVRTEKLSTGSNDILFNTSEYAAGVYTAKIIIGKEEFVRRLVVRK